MNNLVSIIIPVYNVEQYLRDCLDSVLRQTYSCWEAICVDDGSTDGSTLILEEYARRDARFHVIRQRNQRQGAARNRGIVHAKGKYVYFLDADDMIAPDMLSYCVQQCEDGQLDQLIFSSDILFDKEDESLREMSRLYQLPKDLDGKVWSGDELFVSLYRRRAYFVCPPLRFIRRSSIPVWLSFPEKVIFEDNYYTPLLLISAHRIATTSRKLYFRRVRPSSTMTDHDKTEFRANSYFCVYKMLKRNVEKLNCSKECLTEVKRLIADIYGRFLYECPNKRHLVNVPIDYLRLFGLHRLCNILIRHFI